MWLCNLLIINILCDLTICKSNWSNSIGEYIHGWDTKQIVLMVKKEYVGHDILSI